MRRQLPKGSSLGKAFLHPRPWARLIRPDYETAGVPRRYIMRIAAFLLLFLVGMTGSSFAAVSANAQRACMGDYFRYCSYTGGNIPRASACMRRNYARLSRPCKLATAKPAAPGRTHTPKHTTPHTTKHT